MAGQARVRISLSSGDLEIEGTEDFVNQYADAIETLLRRLEQLPAQKLVGQVPSGPTGARTYSTPERREFGEVLHSLPSTASGSDQILLAGAYAQGASADNTFSTGEANELLVGQGVKLSNPSQSLKNAIAAKRVFKVGKRYRLSKSGDDHVTSLTS